MDRLFIYVLITIIILLICAISLVDSFDKQNKMDEFCKNNPNGSIHFDGWNLEQCGNSNCLSIECKDGKPI